MTGQRKKVKKRRVAFPAVLMFVCLFLLSVSGEVYGREVELGADATVATPSADIAADKKKQEGNDPFNTAIIALSIGAMMIVSSVHWHRSKRNELSTKINECRTILNTSAVAFTIDFQSDGDTMAGAMQTLRHSREATMAEQENVKGNSHKLYARIEVEIISLLG